jgi:DNA-binding MltR family transcriptional regulator
MADDKGIELIESMLRESAPIDEESRVFIHTLMDESDRGCVLAGAAYLDDEVELLLRDAFLKPDEAIKKCIDPLLKGGNAPLGSFWAKIKVACAMGLISPTLHDALDKVRELRNAFAHKAGPVSLSDERVAPILNRLEEHVQKVVKVFKLVGEDQQSRVKALVEKDVAGAKELAKEQISVLKTEFALIVGFLYSEIRDNRNRILRKTGSA